MLRNPKQSNRILKDEESNVEEEKEKVILPTDPPNRKESHDEESNVEKSREEQTNGEESQMEESNAEEEEKSSLQ
ncbi:unnamed protein product [Caenorhabditis brenneri]